MRLPHFDYAAPRTLREAIRIYSEMGPDARVMAGGTDLLVRMKHGLLRPTAVINIADIKELRAIRFNSKEGLVIGAAAKLAEVASHPSVRKRYPAVAKAAAKTANVQVRNMGTVGGNLCNAAPSADNAPTLIAMGAEVDIVGLKGERRMMLEDFFRGPRLTALEPGELLRSVRVPVPPEGSRASYQHISARGKVDISAVCVGAMAVFEGDLCRDVRIALGAVAPKPVRALETEALLRGSVWTKESVAAAGRKAAEESRPITDVRASAEYRRNMVDVLTRRALLEVGRTVS